MKLNKWRGITIVLLFSAAIFILEEFDLDNNKLLIDNENLITGLQIIEFGGLDYNVSVDEEIENVLNEINEVEVIVYFKEPRDKYANYGDIESIIREKSIKYLGENIELEYEYESINGFSGNINKDGLEKLKRNPNIKAVYLNQKRSIFLQDSLSLINATLVHNKLINNLNLTGKGQTICILDTGINYSHNDLGGCFGDGCKVISGYDYVNDDNDPYDDNGHGTHVAGISAANGNIKGVAPEANLTIIKVCDSSGICEDNDIIAGIDFCNNNKSKYNINVISMSLGAGLSSDYCNNDPLAPSINAAVGNNIIVIIATGNNGNDAKISAPACVENATSVASSTKQDAISSFSNRNNITDVIAPGEDINSTYLTWGGGRIYRELSGTSMAAPHVAGLVVLLQQYKQEESNRVLTQIEIEKAIKNSDKNITDSNGLNYTRVNVDKALISIDELKPSLTFTISPNPGNLSQSNVSVNFSAFDTNLDSVIVNVTYPNGTLILIALNNFTLLTTNLTVAGDYNIIFYANDSNGNVNQTTVILTVNNITIDNPPTVTLNSPSNYFNTSSTSINFDCSVTDDVDLANLTLYINITGNFLANQTINVTGKSNSTIFNTNLNDGIYIWNCLAFDAYGNNAFAQNNFTLRINTIKPILTDILSSSITSSSAIVTWNTNELTNSIVYYGNTQATSSIQQDNSYVNSHSISLTSLNANTTYYYNVSSCDLVNNCNTSMQFTFTTLTSSSGGSSGSGGSGGSGGGGGSAGGGGGGSSSTATPVSTQEITQTPEELPTEENIPIGIVQENKSTEGNLTQITGEVVKEQPALGKRLLNVITGKTTITGKIIETQTEKNYHYAGLITILSVIALIFYRIFFKKSS